MKIAVFDNLPEGGAKRVVFEQLKYLSKHKHDVFYYTNSHTSAFEFETLPIKLHRFDLSEPLEIQPVRKLLFWYWWRLVDLPMRYQRIGKEIDKSRSDVVIVHHCRYTQTPWLLRFIKSKSVYYIEESLRLVYEPELHPIASLSLGHYVNEKLRRWLLKRIDRALINRAGKLIANSKFTKDNVWNNYRLKTEVVYPGVDRSIFRDISNEVSVKPGTSTTKNYFLFVGDKHWLNGWDLIEEVLKIRPNIVVEVVDFSEGNFRITDREMASKYRNAVATLCLSRNEPFGLAAIESLACGTPVIAVAEGGYAETVLDGKNGSLIKRDVVELIEAMNELLENSLTKKLRVGYDENIVTRFSWENHGDNLIKVIRQVVNA